MTERKFEGAVEVARGKSFSAPAVESFFNPTSPDAAWLHDIAQSSEFIKQVEFRKKLIGQIEQLFSHIQRADKNVYESVIDKEVSAEEVVELYQTLQGILQDPDYERILLYLPFELLPNKLNKKVPKKLQAAAEGFSQTYLATWEQLLRFQDVRANYVDGDVMEVSHRTGDLPRVVKAAHLLPQLVDRGLVDTHFVIELLETTDDEILKHSIADTLPILLDKGLLSEADTQRLDALHDSYTNTKLHPPENKVAEEMEEDTNELDADLLSTKLEASFADIDAQSFEGLPQKRVAWLKQEEKRKAIAATADKIIAHILNEAISDDTAQSLAAPTDPLLQRAFIDAVRTSIEQQMSHNPKSARGIYRRFEALLHRAWNGAGGEAHESLTKTFFHLADLGIMSEQDLNGLGLHMPALAGPFSQNAARFSSELTALGKRAASLESNPELSPVLYPVSVVFGSRVKGYGTPSADIDVAVFVKPGTSTDRESEVQQSLREVYDDEKIQGNVVAFWLDEDGESLRVQNKKPTSPLRGDSWSTHVLFGGVWSGEPTAVESLQKKLLLPYLTNSSEKLFGRDARRLYIEEMERDFLQYRLLHKGYERYHAPVGGLKTPHADSVDGQSMFWDSGYRRTATLLYTRQVFLPKVTEKK